MACASIRHKYLDNLLFNKKLFLPIKMHFRCVLLSYECMHVPAAQFNFTFYVALE